MFVYLVICSKNCPAIYPEICHVGKNILKNHGFQEFASGPRAHLSEVGLTKIPGDHENLIHSPPCRIPCRLFIHEVFFGPLGLQLRV